MVLRISAYRKSSISFSFLKSSGRMSEHATVAWCVRRSNIKPHDIYDDTTISELLPYSHIDTTEIFKKHTQFEFTYIRGGIFFQLVGEDVFKKRFDWTSEVIDYIINFPKSS